MQGCPRTWGLSILARKWSYFVLRALQQPKSFSALQRELRFATNHVLSGELKQLQAESLIAHTGDQYALTTAGAALLLAVEPLHQWGFTHMQLQECPPERSCAKCAQFELQFKPQF